MILLGIVLLKIFVLAIYTTAVDSDVTSWATLIKLKKSLDTGDTLKGKTIKDLQTGEYNVEASGAVLNFLKWPLTLETAESAAGAINCRLPSVKSGVMEGFASHKTGSAATGTWVRYSMLVDDDIMVHFMYSAPYNFNFNTNWLSIAVCPKSNIVCRSLDASKMYFKTYSFMRRKPYYHDNNPVGICYDDTCLMGWMMTDHHPTMHLLVLPKNYFDLSDKIKKRATDLSAEEYEQFINHVFQ